MLSLFTKYTPGQLYRPKSNPNNHLCPICCISREAPIRWQLADIPTIPYTPLQPSHHEQCPLDYGPIPLAN